MAHDDLRAYLAALRDVGHLAEVSGEVDWDLELGAIARRVAERDGPPVWFKRIKDYPAHSVLAHPLATYRCVAVALGLPADADRRQIHRAWQEREARPIAPEPVGAGVCQQNVVTGEAVDLADLPAPMLHDGDGGRFLGTWDLVVSQDPTSGQTNWGVYRFMVHDSRTLTGAPRPASGLGKVLREHYLPRGEPMPIAIVIGADPLCHAAAAAHARLADEPSHAGGLRNAPVRLCKAVTSELLVPAMAEMVIEGEVLPDRVAREGPYGEYTGYRVAELDHGVLVNVTAITHRDDPIHTTDCTGFKDGGTTTSGMALSIGIRRSLEAGGVPVVEVSVPAEGAHHIAVIAVSAGGPAVTQRVLEIVAARFGTTPKLLVVDDDVDVFNWDEVLHAFATRCHPGRGIFVTHYRGHAKKLIPYLDEQERRTLSGATVAFDCTWPPAWDRVTEVPAKNLFHHIYPRELQQRVLDRWQELGLP